MGRVEQDHVLHVLVDIPWIRLDEVKGVVGDDPTDPVILCLGTVVLVSLPPAVVQVSSACLTNKEVHWFYIYKMLWPFFTDVVISEERSKTQVFISRRIREQLNVMGRYQFWKK